MDCSTYVGWGVQVIASLIHTILCATKPLHRPESRIVRMNCGDGEEKERGGAERQQECDDPSSGKLRLSGDPQEAAIAIGSNKMSISK